MAGMRPYRILVARTVTITNHIYIDAESEDAAKRAFAHFVKTDGVALDDEDWGQAFYYQVIKPGAAIGDFEILSIEEA